MKLNRVLAILLTTEQGCRYAKACAALLVVLALMTVVTMTTGWWADATLASPSASTTAAMQDLSSPQNELIQVVPSAHLFGYRAPSSALLPVTSSELRLTGIIQVGAADESNENPLSKAIVSVNGGVGKVYQVGAVLPDGIKLAAISQDSIVLDNGGHLERLPLQRSKLERK